MCLGDLSDMQILLCQLCMVMWGCCRRAFVSRLPRPRGMVPAPSPYQDVTCRTHTYSQPTDHLCRNLIDDTTPAPVVLCPVRQECGVRHRQRRWRRRRRRRRRLATTEVRNGCSRASAGGRRRRRRRLDRARVRSRSREVISRRRRSRARARAPSPCAVRDVTQVITQHRPPPRARRRQRRLRSLDRARARVIAVARCGVTPPAARTRTAPRRNVGEFLKTQTKTTNFAHARMRHFDKNKQKNKKMP